MCLIDRLHNRPIMILEGFIIFIFGMVHLIFGLIIKINKYNEFKVFDLFDSSPLFNLSLEDICKNKSAVVFHTWRGREEIVHNKDNDYIFDEIVIKDETDLKIINGKYFCFKNISYRDLLNNGQIIKKGLECPLEYHKNCGKLDTLEQELCIKEKEKCPL